MLIVLTGPGSSGKDTIALKLLEKLPNLKKVVTTTSRTLRDGEVDGMDYNFVSRAQFEQMIKNGQLLEYVDFSDEFYGTTRDAFKAVFAGQDAIWRIEMSRAGRISEFLTDSFSPEEAERLLQNTKVIYIDVPNWDILKERMRARGTSEEAIERRLTQDKSDFEEYGNSFKHTVMNVPGKLEETLNKIMEIIQSRPS